MASTRYMSLAVLVVKHCVYIHSHCTNDYESLFSAFNRTHGQNFQNHNYKKIHSYEIILLVQMFLLIHLN